MHDYNRELIKIISEKTGVEIDEISPESYFEEDLNIPELELIEILTELEEKYQVDLLEERENLTTVQDLSDLLTELVE
ncbi:MAG: phosphopantetheine-binding protein [Patescibacteria group bacterium]|jgi:acyl carrier protein